MVPGRELCRKSGGLNRCSHISERNLRGQEAHIREQIREGVREDMIAPDDARDLMIELREIRAQEYREFQAYGWQLPYDDGARIHERLVRLDRRWPRSATSADRQVRRA